LAVTAARVGALAKGTDLTPVLLHRARENAAIAGVEVGFREGDAEALSYHDAFDVVLSRFGHMFTPRPEVATARMLRVLKPGGRIAFSTCPSEHTMSKSFGLLGRNISQPPPGVPTLATPPSWGDPRVVRERLGDVVTELRFDRGVAPSPALSLRHAPASMGTSFGPPMKILQDLEQRPDRVAQVRSEMLDLFEEVFAGNCLQQHFLMSRASKK